MMTPILSALGLFAACISVAAGQNSNQGGLCSATTIWYNDQIQLQASMASVQSSYSICSNATVTTAPTTTTSTTAPATTSSSCALQPTPPCFYIVGHGESHIEGLKLGWQQGESSPQFNYPATIFYIDGSGYLHTANSFNGVTMTYYNGPESWWGIFQANAPQLWGSDYSPSTCTANADGTLDCFQHGGINSDLINVWEYTYDQDSRAFYLPHWGPAGMMQTITLTWEATTCPNLC